MRIGLSLLAGGLVMLWFGGRSVYEAAASGKQQTLSYNQFVKKHPGMGWYKVTYSGWHLQDSLYVTSKKKTSLNEKVRLVFLPVHAAKTALGPNDKISVILQTEREDIMNFMQQAVDSGSGSMPTPPENLLAYAGAIEGTVAFGGDLDADSRDKLRETLGARLDPNYVVIRDGAKPNGWLGVLLLGGGVVVAGLGGIVLLNRDGDN